MNRVVSAVGLAAVIGVGGWSAVGQENQALPQPSEWVSRTVGDVVLDLPPAWRATGDTAPDEGRWVQGPAESPRASIALLRDRTFEQLQTGLAVEQSTECQLGGRAAAMFSGKLADGGGARRGWVVVQKTPDPDGSLRALFCTATEADWAATEPVFRTIVASVRSPGEPRPTAMEPTVSSPAPDAPSTRWYIHGRGDYRFRLPPGWTVTERTGLSGPDGDFDTITDPARTIQVICSRVYDTASDAEKALARWREQRLRQIRREQYLLADFRVSGAPALRIAYDWQPGRCGVQMAWVCHGRRYAITLYYPAELGMQELPPMVAELLQSMQFLRDPAVFRAWPRRTVGNLTLPVPPDWLACPQMTGGDVLAAWASSRGQGGAKLLVSKAVDRAGLIRGIAPLERTMGVSVGEESATAYLGPFREPAGYNLIVLLDHADADGRTLALFGMAPGEKWSGYESTFLDLLAAAQVSGDLPHTTLAKPRPTGELGRYAKLDGLIGEGEYSLVSCRNGAIVTDLRTGREEMLWIDRPGHEVESLFRRVLAGNAELSEKLGPALTERISVFQDALRVQLFEGGVMASETAYRHIWWSWHAPRSGR